MEIVQLNANAKLSEHLASPSEATLGHSNKLDGSRLSPHFTLGEFTRSGSHPEVYNIPSHEAIANLKRLCVWLEELRKRYNDKYVINPSLSSRPSVSSSLSSRPSVARGEISQMRPGAQAAARPLVACKARSRKDSSTTLGMTSGGTLGMTNHAEQGIRINSGYRSPQLNRAIGGVSNSNHLTGCAVDIRVENMEQLIRYASILLDISNDTKQDFDELLIERRSASPLGSSKNRHGAIWLHFAVRPKDNRRKVALIQA